MCYRPYALIEFTRIPRPFRARAVRPVIGPLPVGTLSTPVVIAPVFPATYVPVSIAYRSACAASTEDGAHTPFALSEYPDGHPSIGGTHDPFVSV